MKKKSARRAHKVARKTSSTKHTSVDKVAAIAILIAGVAILIAVSMRF